MRSLRPTRAFVVLILTALFTSACALTSQGPTPTPPATATNVPDIVVITSTPDPAMFALTMTASAPQVIPTTVAQVVAVTQIAVTQVAAAVQPLVVNLPVPCNVRTDWQPYTIQAGDTIGALAIATNIALVDLVIGNCLANPDVINVGETVYLPGAPAQIFVSAATPLPGSTAPTIGFVLIEPAMVDSGRYLVAPGLVTLRAQGVTNASRVTFYYSPVGTQGGPTLIGADDNMADGAVIQWTLDRTPLLANVWAVATSPGNVDSATDPILVANNG